MLKINECKKLMKKCKICGELKLISKFRKNRNQCKTCVNSKAKLKHSLVCLECGKEFTSKRKEQKFCSIECKNNHNSKEVLCDCCKKLIKVENNRIKRSNHHFCSKECQNKWQSENKRGENHPNYNKVEILCDYCKKPIKINKCRIERSNHHFCDNDCYNKWKSENLKDENNYRYNKEEVLCDYCKKPIKLNKYRIENCNLHFCSYECYGKWQSENRKGKNSPNWNPNLTNKERIVGRKYEEYYDFRKQVFERDNYTCQITGKRGGKLQAHHLNCYSDYKEERTDINNGITLSKEIHRLFHKIYGNKHNTKEQFEEFKHRYHNGEFKEVI